MMFTYNYIVHATFSSWFDIIIFSYYYSNLMSVLLIKSTPERYTDTVHWFMIHKVTRKLIHTFILYRILILLAHFFWTNLPFELHITITSFLRIYFHVLRTTVYLLAALFLCTRLYSIATAPNKTIHKNQVFSNHIISPLYKDFDTDNETDFTFNFVLILCFIYQ